MKLKTLTAILVFTFSASAITGRVLADAHHAGAAAAQPSVEKRAEAKTAAIESFFAKGLHQLHNASTGDSSTRVN